MKNTRIPSTVLAFVLLAVAQLFGCGGDTIESDGCYVGGKLVACPDPEPAKAAPLCAVPGGESITPVASCTWAAPPAMTPTTIVYGSVTALQVCDFYPAINPTGADARGMIVSSGMTGGTRSAVQWVAWAKHVAAFGVDATHGADAYVCDVRHSGAGGVYPFPAPNSDARCILRTLGLLSPTGHVRGYGASAGATLLDWADALADRTSGTSGATTVTFDDGTCTAGWSSTDAAVATRINLWSEVGDVRVKAKINPGTQTNLDQYLNTVPGTALWTDLSTLASPVLWYRSTMAPRLVMGSAGDIVVYPEQTVGTGDPTVGTSRLTCTSVHPTLLTGTLNAVRAAGPNCTAILNHCPVITHFPTFGNGGVAITSGECTADVF